MKRSDLRQAYERLLRQTTDAEKQVLDVANRLVMDTAADSDAAIGALLADHAQLVEDVQRIRNVDAWVDRIAMINPRAENRFHNQVRKMCAWLSDLNRRDDAVRAMDWLQKQIAWFYPLPLEQRLSEMDRQMIELTAGRQQELRNVINTVRADWAEAWAAGNAVSEAGNHMLLLYRLMRCAEELMSLENDAAAALNAWGPWSMPHGAMQQPQRDLAGFVKLAVAAAVMNDWVEVRRHLGAIESAAAEARLAGRLSLTLQPVLVDASRKEDSIAHKHTEIASEEAWLINRRVDVAHLCRYMAELQLARASGNRELVQRLGEYVNALTRDLLGELHEPPDALPALPGFEGE
jgi:hypothetical protein